MSIRLIIISTGCTALFAFLMSCSSPETYYSARDFEKVSKIDAHFHYLTKDTRYIDFASAHNFRILSVNWNGEEYSIDEQFKIATSILSERKGKFSFFGTFSVDSFGKPDFAEKTIACINENMKAGASGIKIWKNIGMVLKDSSGKFVMIDNPAFEPVIKYLEQNNITVMGHLGEPKDCWLPLNEMIDPGAVIYFKENPRYYMFLHPEAPSYDEQIRARDNILRKHPKLNFIGAHLASLEWSIDELVKHLDIYPALKVDLAARMGPVKYQSKINREKVRDFMIRYQDRILYGTDFIIHDEPGLDYSTVTGNLYKGWMENWIYLATDSTLEVKGLRLPKEVIDKIYFKNAEKYFQ